jgi:hypothetical protein
MLRYVSMLLLPALLFLVNPAPANDFDGPPDRWSGWRDRRGDGPVGEYTNRSNGGECSVYRSGRNYVFVNENGSRARFAFTAPRRLEMVSGSWDASVVVTVTRDRRGRTVLRFTSANSAPGYWVPAN